jgi:hypothetical protein
MTDKSLGEFAFKALVVQLEGEIAKLPVKAPKAKADTTKKPSSLSAAASA